MRRQEKPVVVLHDDWQEIPDDVVCPSGGEYKLNMTTGQRMARLANPLRDAALDYAARGWPVFPLVPGTKVPFKDSRGYLDATTDEATIRKWWTTSPKGNIGISTGPAGLAVIDIDVKKGKRGPESWRDLRADTGLSDDTPTCETPSDGSHLYYLSNGHRIKSGTDKLGDGLDVKSEGGYVVAPPSVIVGSEYPGEYTWVLGHRPTEKPLLPIPEELLDLLEEAGEPVSRPVPQRDASNLAAEVARAAVALEQLDTGRADEYQAWVEVGMSLRELGDAGLALWAGWSAQSAKWAPGTCAKKWATFTPGDGVTLASLYTWAKEDIGDKVNVRPLIDAGIQDLDHVTQLAWEIVETSNNPPLLFLHGGQVVRLEVGEPSPGLAGVDVDRLRYEAARVARWRVRRKVDGVWKTLDARPPAVVMRNMLARPTAELALPIVDRIVHCPVFAPDGALQCSPGYHAEGRVIVCTDPDLQLPAVPAQPTQQQVKAAVAAIDDLLRDFPFIGAADRAHAFALLLLPLVRDMIAGPTPLHLVESATPGSGKGLLTTVLLTPALGDEVATMAAGRDDEEWRKRLTTVLRTGQPAVVIDNVRESIDAAPLSAALTARWWDDRILGASELVHLPVRCVWAASGNNPMLSTEIARRTVRIRIDPKVEQPWRREASTFKYPELLTHAQQRRGEILAAGLTLAQAWIAAGQPRASTPPLGSYEPWVRVIGGILAFAKINGFLANLDELYERADSEGAVWRRFVSTWWETHEDQPVGVAELYPIALELDDFPLGDGKERSQKTCLGKGLKEKQDMVLASYRIESAGTYKNAARYLLRKTITDSAGEPGEPGEHFGPTEKTGRSFHGLGGEVNQVMQVNQAELPLDGEDPWDVAKAAF